LDSLSELWRYAERLKLEERKGWKALGLRHVESVADHSFALALLTLVEAERRKYNVEDAVKIALIHDLEEAITGDLTPGDKKTIGLAKVRVAKEEAVRELLMILPQRSRRTYRRLWTDLRLLRTSEARLVHELDRLEMVFQAKAYETKVCRKKVTDFYRSACKEIRDPRIGRVLNLLTRRS
jgi:putative hydrolases of HD superfamily